VRYSQLNTCPDFQESSHTYAVPYPTEAHVDAILNYARNVPTMQAVQKLYALTPFERLRCLNKTQLVAYVQCVDDV
jgi:hypothetical protein